MSKSSTESATIIDTSYNPHAHPLRQHPTNIVHDDPGVAVPVSITKPAAAYTNSPYIFDRNALAMPGPLEELTPPPSPDSAESPNKIRKTPKPSVSLNTSFLPFLNRTSTPAAQKRNSAASISPTRSTRSGLPLTPSDGTTCGAAANGNTASSNRLSKGFSDFFQLQGNSAPVSFGVLPTPSPKKEQGPLGSPFGPAGEGRPQLAIAPTASNSPTRPHHARRGSTLSAAASLFGLNAGVGRGGTTSPVRRSARSRTRVDDEIMRLDFENEVFPNDSLGGKGEKAFDELLANSERLFERTRNAYAKKCDALNDMDDSRRTDKEELEEQRLRADHLKAQLDKMGKKLCERDEEVEELEKELEGKEQRSKTIRVLPSSIDGLESRPGSAQISRIWSATGEDVFEVSNSRHSKAESERHSISDLSSRPVSSAASTLEDATMKSAQPQRPRNSMTWVDAAPFLPPVDGLETENKDLKRRVRELEETLQSCLGLVDA